MRDEYDFSKACPNPYAKRKHKTEREENTMTRLPIEHEPHHGRSGHHKRFADILRHLRNREHFTQCGLTQSYLTAIHTLVYNKSDVVITNQKEGGNNVAL